MAAVPPNVYRTEDGRRVQARYNYERFFCIYPGNGHNIIRAALVKKRGWKELPVQQAFSAKCNFVWKPTNFTYKMFCQID